MAVLVLGLLAAGWPAAAADSPVGKWVKKVEPGKMAMTLTIEEWGSKAKLTYTLKDAKMVLTIVSNLDGSDAPVLLSGKPSGETMAIKRVDKRHATTVVKMNGKTFGTSKSSFSDDFNVLTVENDFTEGGGPANPPGKVTEVWTRK
jgi:hypothetical protein